MPDANGEGYRPRTEERITILEEILATGGGATSFLSKDPRGREGSFDMEATLRRLGGDRELLAEAAQVFLAEIPGALCRVREAVRRSDAKALVDAAHGMRGMASNFDAIGLGAEARRLELLGSDGDLVGARGALPDVEREAARLVADLEAMVVREGMSVRGGEAVRVP